MTQKLWNNIMLDFVLDRDTLKSNFNTQEVTDFLLKNHNKYSIKTDNMDQVANRTLQDLSLKAAKHEDRIFVNTEPYKGNWEVNITHEKEWVSIVKEIIERTQLDGISIKEINELPFLEEYLKPGDKLVRRTVRKGEQWYAQQLRNLVSHKNKAFDYKVIDGEKYILRKNANNVVDKTLLLGLDEAVTAISAATADKISKSDPKLVDVKGGKRFATSTPLKNYVKKLRNHSCEFGCEMNKVSFKNSKGVWYTEAHHIIPMKYQQSVSVNLDDKDNLIVLCPKHHMEFHHGDRTTFGGIIRALKEYKKQPKILITDFNELSNYYNKK